MRHRQNSPDCSIAQLAFPLLIHLVTHKIWRTRTWFRPLIQSSMILKWTQIDEMVADVIQHPLVRLTFRQKVPIMPIRFILEDRPEFRYFMY